MKQKIQFIFILFGATISSLGTYPYAKEFSNSILENHNFSLLIAGILVPAAVSANIALGTYSLQNTMAQTKENNFSRTFFVILISALSALSTGFICFVGYHSKLPVYLNFLISAMVVIVNAGIGFSAINNALNDFSNQSWNMSNIFNAKKKKTFKSFLSIITIISALMVTLTAYFASTHGLTTIVERFQISSPVVYKMIYPLAILIWLPGAVLFANGSRATVAKIYDSITHSRINFSYLTIIITLVAIASGSAYAQMALEFFDSGKNIPVFFKEISKHYNFIFYFFMPAAFIISAIVNGYALDKLVKGLKK